MNELATLFVTDNFEEVMADYFDETGRNLMGHDFEQVFDDEEFCDWFLENYDGIYNEVQDDFGMSPRHTR